MKKSLLALSLACAAAVTAPAAPRQLPVRPFGNQEGKPFYSVRPISAETGSRWHAPMRTPASVTSLGGANLNRGALERGVYSFAAVASPAFTSLLPDVELNGGAVYVNGRYYAHTYDYDSQYNLTLSKWLCYDAETWRKISETDCPMDFTYIAADRTYDSSTGKVYSLGYDRTATNLRLVTTSLTDGAPTLVGEFPEDKVMLCIAATGDGRLFTLDTFANLYSVDPATAAITLIGNTNIFDQYETGYTQSMTYDNATGKIYWAEFHTEGFGSAAGALYAIDPATAATVKIFDMPSKAEFTGLFSLDAGIPDAPAPLTSLKAVPRSEGADEVCFSFSAPSLTNSGVKLTEDLTVEVVVDDETIDLIDGIAPGTDVTTGWYTLARGAHIAKLRAENAAGQSANAAVAFFVGYDVPAAPADLRLTAAGDAAVLAWTAPATGAEGGALRTPVTYDVVRMPGNVTVASAITATTFTETVPAAGLYSYTVTASSPDGKGLAAESNKVVIGEFAVPYLQTFDTTDAADLFTVVDANGDGRTWAYFPDNRCMRYSYSILNDADDWLVSPALTLDGSKSYSLSFDSYKYLAGYNENIEVWYGTSADPAAMTMVGTVSVPSVDATSSRFVVPAKASGAHYFAIHAVSPKNQMFIYIDNFAVVEEGKADVPAAVSGLTATPCGDSYADIRIDLTAPATALNGAPVEGLQRVDLYRGSATAPCHTFTAPAPGEKLSWTDAALRQGSYTYRAVAVNAAGESEAAAVTAYAGIDTPLPATSVVMTVENGSPVVEWTAPAAGANGGNMDGLLTYDIVRVYNANETTVAEGVADTRFTDSAVDADTQAYLYYAVIARTPAGAADAAYSEGIVVGKPHVAPWSESFANQTMQSNPWFVTLLNGNSGGWSIVARQDYPTAKPQDADGGFAAFDGYHTWSANARLTSPRIAISHLANPVLSFYMYHYKGDSWSGETGSEYVRAQLQVEIAVDGGAVTEIPGALFELYATSDGWVKHEVSLKDYKDCEYVNISFKGLSGYTYNIYIDNISVGATYTNNVEVASFTAPASVTAGLKASFSGSVLNSGKNASGIVTASLYLNGEKVTGKSIRSIAAGATADIELSADVPAVLADAGECDWQLRLSMSGDENSLDNLSQVITTPVVENDLPAVDDLAAEANGNNVHLCWTTPALAADHDHLGFHIYCNGKRITDTAHSGNAYVHSDLQNGTYSYGVSVVYAEGESSLSNRAEATIELQGIASATTATLKVRGTAGAIAFEGNDAILRVTAVDGTLLHVTDDASGSVRLAPGIYVVSSSNGYAAKVKVN